MSTRAVFTFADASGTFHVYKHHDGYPSGAAAAIASAIPHAWRLPRFEADEFAAAFIAGNKPSRNQEAANYRAMAADAIACGKEDHAAFCNRTADEYEGGRYEVGGSVRLTKHWRNHGDLAYRYEIKATKQGELQVTAYADDGFMEPELKRVFRGTLEQFSEWAEQPESD